MKIIDVYMIKHTNSVWNELKRTQGHCDVELSELGNKKAELISTRKELENVKIIYSSDLKRAYQTIEPLSKKIGVKIIKTQNLREGNWKNHYIDSRYPPKKFLGGYEDDSMVLERSVKTMNNILKNINLSPIIVVTHGAFIRLFLNSIYLGKGKLKAIKRGAINHIQYNNGFWNIIKLNKSSHLDII